MTVTEMYEELIEELRRPHADCNPWALMEQAADAIETLIGKVKYLIERCDMADKNCSEAVRLGAMWKEAALERMPRWILVVERLPEKRDYYLAFTQANETYVCDFIPSVNQWWIEPCDKRLGNVTHWMPLPEPPKEET